MGVAHENLFDSLSAPFVEFVSGLIQLETAKHAKHIAVKKTSNLAPRTQHEQALTTMNYAYWN